VTLVMSGVSNVNAMLAVVVGRSSIVRHGFPSDPRRS
jgi:hypothetical protein